MRRHRQLGDIIGGCAHVNGETRRQARAVVRGEEVGLHLLIALLLELDEVEPLLLCLRVRGQCAVLSRAATEHDRLGLVPHAHIEIVVHDGPAHGNEALHGENGRGERDRASERVWGRPYRRHVGDVGGAELRRRGDKRGGRDVPRHGDDDIAVLALHAVHVMCVNAEADELAGGLSLLLDALGAVEQHAEDAPTTQRHHHLGPVGGGGDGHKEYCRLLSTSTLEHIGGEGGGV